MFANINLTPLGTTLCCLDVWKVSGFFGGREIVPGSVSTGSLEFCVWLGKLTPVCLRDNGPVRWFSKCTFRCVVSECVISVRSHAQFFQVPSFFQEPSVFSSAASSGRDSVMFFKSRFVFFKSRRFFSRAVWFFSSAAGSGKDSLTFFQEPFRFFKSRGVIYVQFIMGVL